MTALRTYIEEAIDELQNKVSWPSWKELWSSSIIVLIATFIIAILIYGMDFASSNLLKQIYNLF